MTQSHLACSYPWHFSEQIVQKNMEMPFLLRVSRNMDTEVLASFSQYYLKALNTSVMILNRLW